MNEMNVKTNESERKEKSTARTVFSKGSELFVIIASLLAAFAFWGYVMSMESPTSERTFSGVEVSISNMEKLNDVNNLSIVSESNNLVVDVILQGKKTVLNKLTSDDIKAYIDVGNITEAGTHSLDVKYLPFPEGTTFVAATSSSMSMKVDTKAEVEVPIVVKYDNCIIPDGYSVGNYVLSVDTIKVEGARADIDKIKEARITISTGTLTKSLSVRDAVPVICDRNGREVVSEYISYDKIFVDVSVPVYLKKEIDLQYKLIHGFYNDDTTTVSLSPSKITVFGDASVVSSVKDNYVICTINEKNTPDKFAVSIVPGMFGNGVEVMNGVDKVDVNIVHKKTVTTMLQIDTPYIKVNNPHGLSYVLPEDGILVSFRCLEDKLAGLDIDNVVALVDLSSVGGFENYTDVAVTFNYSSEISGYAYELGNYTVRVSFNAE